MIKALTYIALLVTIAAGSALLYRNQPYSIKIEREMVEQKEPEKVLPLPSEPAFGPVPHVTVTSLPPATLTLEASPAPAKKRVVKRKPTAVKKLKSKWAAPQAKPFSLGDLFNVR